MSKNFETEYKKYADNTVPDLWSRIEAGVDAYEESIKDNGTGSDEVKKGKIVNIEDYNKNNTENKGTYTDSQEDNNITVRKKINIKPYIGALAACACLFLVVVVMKNVISSSKSATTAESAAPAAAPAMEAASEAAEESSADFEAKSEEAYDEAAEEAVEEAVEAYTDDFSDDAAYMDEAPAADAAAPAMEYEEAAEAEEAEEPELSTYAAGESNKDITNDIRANGKHAASSESEKKVSSSRDIGKEITVLAVPDIKTLNNDEGSMELRITDPADSDLKKDEVITVSIPKDKNGKYINAGMDIKTIDGSESRIYKVTLTLSDDGEYMLTSIDKNF